MRHLAIIEDNRFLRTVFKEFIAHIPDFTVPIAVADFHEFVAALKKWDQDIDYVLLDINTHGFGESEGVSLVKELIPEAKVIVMSNFSTEELIVNTFRNGACSFIIKNHRLADICNAINAIETYGAYISPTAAQSLINSFRNHMKIDFNTLFTKREKELLKLVIRGMSYKEMASKMSITAFTINHHLKKIYQKLNVRSKAELISKISGLEKNYDAAVFINNRQLLIA